MPDLPVAKYPLASPFEAFTRKNPKPVLYWPPMEAPRAKFNAFGGKLLFVRVANNAPAPRKYAKFALLVGLLSECRAMLTVAREPPTVKVALTGGMFDLAAAVVNCKSTPGLA